MEAQGTLQVVAEISIELTGFAGIVDALASGRLTRQQPHIWLPFWSVLELGLGTLFAALFPMLPYHLGAADWLVWATSSGFVVFLLGCHMAFMAPRFLGAAGNPSYVRLQALENVLRVALLLALVTQRLNTIGVGLRHTAGGFLIGLYCLLLVSALNFTYVIFVLIRPENGAPAAARNGPQSGRSVPRE